MSLGFLLRARYSTGSFLRKRTPQHVLADIDRWWLQNASAVTPVVRRADVGTPAEPVETTIVVHPAAVPVSFEVTEPGTLVVTATTSLVGPGYHRFLVDHLKRMAADLDLAWVGPAMNEDPGDETGYFETGDREAVTASMLAFGRDLARAVLGAAADGATDASVGMPPEVGYPGAGFLVTTTGPRDRAFVESAAAGNEAAIRALNPWWDDDLDGRFALARALVRMWCEVAWAGPLEEAERIALEQVDGDLERAARAGLEVPEAEWNEVRALLGRPAARPGVAPLLAHLGYRRGLVRAVVGPWSVMVPGSFYLTTDGDAFLAYRDGSIRMSTWSRDPDADPATSDPWDVVRLEAGRLIATIDEPGLLGCATEQTLEGDDGPSRMVTAVVAAPHTLAVATLTHPPEQAGQALEMVRSMAPVERDAEPPAGWTPRSPVTWNRDLLVSALDRLAEDPGGGWFVVCSVPGALGYVQASSWASGRLHTEAAGERHDPRLADPALVARLLATGWSPASSEAAGNHVRDWEPPVDTGLIADHLVGTLRDVYGLADDELVDLVLDR